MSAKSDILDKLRSIDHQLTDGAYTGDVLFEITSVLHDIAATGITKDYWAELVVPLFIKWVENTYENAWMDSHYDTIGELSELAENTPHEAFTAYLRSVGEIRSQVGLDC